MAARTKTKEAPQATLIAEEPKAAAVPAVQQAGQAITRADDAPTTLLSIIDRASRDPTVDVDRLERLIGIYERQQASNARTEYNAAMSMAQEEMKGIRANSNNPSTKSKYASYGALDKAIRPIYTKHGFALSFDTGEAPKQDDVRILCMVSHRGGHMQEHHIDMPADGKGAKGGDVMSRTHATGAAVTYGTRYLAGMIFNLAILKDNDGNDAGDRARDWTDGAIEHLNTANLDKAALEKWRAESEKSIAWLKKNAPDQFERFQTAYSNAAESAGIKKEEPKRGDQQPVGQAAVAKNEAPAKGRRAAPAKTITDVDDENQKPAAAQPDASEGGKPATVPEPIEFGEFKTAREFLDFSSGWLDDPARTPAEAKQWEATFRAKIKELAEHKFGWVREGTAACIGAYSGVLAKEQPE